MEKYQEAVATVVLANSENAHESEEHEDNSRDENDQVENIDDVSSCNLRIDEIQKGI